MIETLYLYVLKKNKKESRAIAAETALRRCKLLLMPSCCSWLFPFKNSLTLTPGMLHISLRYIPENVTDHARLYVKAVNRNFRSLFNRLDIVDFLRREPLLQYHTPR